MTPAAALLADLRSRGIDLETDGERLRWRPAFLVTAPQAAAIGAHRTEIIAMLRAHVIDELAHCPACRRPLDHAGRCPKCFDRRCAGCGRLTGSYFIMTCNQCVTSEVGAT